MKATFKVKKKYIGSVVKIEPLKKAFHVTLENYDILSANGFGHYYVKNTTSTDKQDIPDTSGETDG